MTKQVNFYNPKNFLKEKSGVGGLPDHIIALAQKMADSIKIDFHPFAKDKITSMKNQIQSERFITAQNDNSIDDFLYDLIPFDVNAKLSHNKVLSLISDNLLKFVETLDLLNVDSQHVVKAHVSAMDIITKQNLDKAENSETIRILLKELTDLCQRFYTKHGIVKKSIDLNALY